MDRTPHAQKLARTSSRRAAYIGVGMGAGPRDGLMTGLVRMTRGSVRRVRTALEVVVVLTGWLLCGTVGAATALYAVTIGPIVQLAALPPLDVSPRGALSGRDSVSGPISVPSQPGRE